MPIARFALAVALLGTPAAAHQQDYAIAVAPPEGAPAHISAAETAAVARLTAKASACIDANASAVEAAQPDLASGVTFLIDDLCAREVTVLGRYKRNSALLRMMTQSPNPSGSDDDDETPAQKAAARKLIAASTKMYGNAKVNPDTGEVTGLPSNSSFLLGFASGAGSSADAPDLRAMAAEHLLAARRTRAAR